MKKLLALILTIAVITGLAVPISAENAEMQTALAGVKSRIEIPENYTVFRSSMSDYGKVTYNFSWSDAEGKEQLTVTADSEGRLKSYYISRNIPSSDYPSLPSVDRESAQKLADAFLAKAAPELVANEKDRLKASSAAASMSGSTTWYSFNYNRIYNGTPVIENNAHISVTAYNGGAYVSDVSINWNYDMKFSDEAAELENPERKYLDQFPIELRYERTYENIIKKLADGTSVVDDVVLLYGFKESTGYISAVDGSVLEPEYDDTYRMYGGSGGGSNEAMKEMAADTSFSVAEIAELERVDSLISDEEAEKLLRSLPALSITDKMTVRNVRVYRTRPWYLTEDNDADKERFMISISLRDNETGDNVSMTADAETGEVVSVFRYGGEKSSSVGGEKDIDAFLKAAAPEKLSECEAAEITEKEYGISASIRRLINGVPYNNNGITYSYSKEYSRITNYNLQWDEYTDFTDPKEAMDRAAAEEKILSYTPLETIYIPNGGEYRLCYTISKPERYAEIDAVTGEQLNKDYNSERENLSYSDIAGHWAESAVMALVEVGIGEAEPVFRPNEKMTQRELLTYLASALLGGSYWDYDEESFYGLMERRGYIKAEEKTPSASVMREDAFVYMIRLMGYDRVARLEGVYDCKYDDASALSPDKTGYAAILTGFDVVSGDGRNLRPMEKITRAECAMMVYKYLSYKGA